MKSENGIQIHDQAKSGKRPLIVTLIGLHDHVEEVLYRREAGRSLSESHISIYPLAGPLISTIAEMRGPCKVRGFSPRGIFTSSGFPDHPFAVQGFLAKFSFSVQRKRGKTQDRQESRHRRRHLKQRLYRKGAKAPEILMLLPYHISAASCRTGAERLQ